MANGSVLQNIMNPPGTDFPERLSDLRTARVNRETAKAATRGQNLANAQAQIEMVGQSAQAFLNQHYEEGQEQPTNPTQAAKDYFSLKKRLEDQEAVPQGTLPNRVPRRSEAEFFTNRALSVKEQLALQQGREPEQFTLGPGQVRFETGPEGRTRPVATGLPEEETPSVKSQVSAVDKRTGEGATLLRTDRGLALQSGVDEQGNPVLDYDIDSSNYRIVDETGTTEELGLASKTEGALEEEINEADKALQRLSRIEQSFRPEFQETWTRLGFAWDAAKEKAGVNLNPQEREDLDDFSRFKQETLNNINLYIKEITGAQMSEAEADRLRQAAPDPGEGIFDGDSPTQFQSKLSNSMEIARAARRRAQYARENGLMDELRRGVQSEGEMSGELDLDNFIEAPNDVNSIIDRALGNE